MIGEDAPKGLESLLWAEPNIYANHKATVAVPPIGL